MQKIAQSWLVLSVGGSAFYLGLDAFLGELPILLFTLIGGVVADRYDRRLPPASDRRSSRWRRAFVADGPGRRWIASRSGTSSALSFVAGRAQAFGGPAYQSLIPTLVPKSDLPNAIALNSIQFNLARVIGPLARGRALAAARDGGLLRPERRCRSSP